MRPLIYCEHVDFGYENYDAVQDLSMEIMPGDYLCIVGSNGSGKSTLIKGILGLIKPTQGSLFLDEELRRGGIGYLPQQTAAQKDFPATVQEVVLSGFLSRMGMRPYYTKSERYEAFANMEKLGIRSICGYCYRELSGGQQQRVLIARALCATRQMLILDEPVTGLDPAAIQEFYHILKRLNEQDRVTILMVSHDIQNVLHYANKILHLQKEVLYYGPVDGYETSRAGRMFFHKYGDEEERQE